MSRSRQRQRDRVEVTAHARGSNNPTTGLALPSRKLDFLAANNVVVCGLPTPIEQPAPFAESTFRIRRLQRLFLNAASDGLGGPDATSCLGDTVLVHCHVDGDELRAGWLLTLARILGKREILRLSPTFFRLKTPESQIQAGQNPLSFDAPYQSSIATCVRVRGLPRWSVRNIDVQVNKSVSSATSRCDSFGARLLRRRISDGLRRRALTGLSTQTALFITDHVRRTIATTRSRMGCLAG